MMFPPKPGKSNSIEDEAKSNPLIGKYDDFYTNAKVYDQKFGIVLTSDNLKIPAKTSLSYGPDNFYPWRPFAAPDRTSRKLNAEREELLSKFFAIHIDVQHFKPNEIHIKVTGRLCNVKANHGDREDEHGFVSRRFERQFTLPRDIDVDSVKSVISSDGVLTFKAARTKPKKIKRHGNSGFMISNTVDFNSADDTRRFQEVEDYMRHESSKDDVEIEIPIQFVRENTERIENEKSE